MYLREGILCSDCSAYPGRWYYWRLATYFSECIIFTQFHRFWTGRIGADDLLRHADFRRYWFSSILNGFGGYIGGLAVPLCAVLL